MKNEVRNNDVDRPDSKREPTPIKNIVVQVFGPVVQLENVDDPTTRLSECGGPTPKKRPESISTSSEA